MCFIIQAHTGVNYKALIDLFIYLMILIQQDDTNYL